jgi:hypothetical protein
MVGCGGAGSSGNNSGGTNTGGNAGTPGAGPKLYFTATPYTWWSAIESIPATGNGLVAATTYFDTRGIGGALSPVAMDSAGNFYASMIDPQQTSNTPLLYKIVEFAASATGSSQPIRTIPGRVT